MTHNPSALAQDERAVVLYVDDDRANLLMFRAVAEPIFQVLLAQSGDEALFAIEQHTDIAVLLTDYRMAGMNGIDLCENVHASRPEIVRMLVTAYSDLQAAIAAINRGQVSRYLRKPWNPDELLATLAEGVEQHRLKKRMQQLQLRMAESERLSTLGILTASLGHELRTPLSVVSSNVQFAKSALHTALTKPGDSVAKADLTELIEALADASMGAQRLIEVTDSILLSARKDPGDQKPVDLAEVIQSVLRLLRHETMHNARLEVSLSAKPILLGSPARVGQVLLNLLLNAVQALPKRPGNVIRISLAQKDKLAVLEVADNGPGIEPDKLARIFDPFFSTKSQGTGLGLSITQQIVKDMGGRIEVESEPQKGALFRITWPVARV